MGSILYQIYDPGTHEVLSPFFPLFFEMLAKAIWHIWLLPFQYLEVLTRCYLASPVYEIPVAPLYFVKE